MTKRKFLEKLVDNKTILQIAQHGLKDIDFLQGVEAVAGIPL